MKSLLYELRQTVFHPDWTRLSLAMYLATPLIWWRLAHADYDPYVLLIELLISASALSGGIIAYLRSRAAWQRALSLQVGLILAPSTASIVSRIFWSDALDWAHGRPLSPLAIAGIYAAFSIPWLGLMFMPALLVPFQRVIARAGTTPPVVDKQPLPALKAPVMWRTWLLWIVATFAPGVIFSVTAPAAWLLYPLLIGLLQWLVLRRHFRGAGLWMAATAAGLVCSSYLAGRYVLEDLYVGQRGELDPILSHSAFGAVLGVAQWLVLRRASGRAFWWVLVNMLGWPMAWAASRIVDLVLNIDVANWIDLAVRGTVAGAVTGLVLVWLLGHSRSEPTDQQAHAPA